MAVGAILGVCLVTRSSKSRFDDHARQGLLGSVGRLARSGAVAQSRRFPGTWLALTMLWRIARCRRTLMASC